MLQSEFYDRTKVNLTGEEYAKVEDIYNSVQMDKDDFCKLWLKNRDNRIINEMMTTIHNMEGMIARQRDELELRTSEMEAAHEEFEMKLHNASASHNTVMKELGRKIILEANKDEMRIMDVVEEALGFDFIIQTKLEENIELTEAERAYLVKKMKQFNKMNVNA